MLNFNRDILPNDQLFLTHENRGFKYGDALFETFRVVNEKIIFWEDHYLRLMASMRILRMNIPMSFTMEYLEAQIIETVKTNKLDNSSARIRLNVYRNEGGFYLPKSNNVSFIIEAVPLKASFFVLSDEPYEVELFKDFYVNADMLSNLKTNNRSINVVGSIYAKENGYDNCLLLNSTKQVVEVLNGNIFVVKGNQIKTPPKKDGCINGIIRKKLLDIVSKIEGYSIEEASISPFELQKADELFITNSVLGIQPITKYRKKEYKNSVAKELLGKLNAIARLT